MRILCSRKILLLTRPIRKSQIVNILVDLSFLLMISREEAQHLVLMLRNINKEMMPLFKFITLQSKF